MLMRHLKFFATLAQERHFGRAAELCNVTQPTLSQAIRKLEEDLGVALIIRNHRFLRLTPEGEKALLWGRQILADYDNLQQDLGGSRRGLSGVLRLGAAPAVLPVAGFLSEAFEAENPETQVEMRSMSAQDLRSALERFEIDGGIGYLDDPALEGLVRLPLYQERAVFACRRDHPLARRKSVTWVEAAQEPLCLLSEAAQDLGAVAEKAGAAIAPQILSDSLIGVAAHLRNGRWCAIAPHSFAFVFGATDLALRDMAGPAFKRPVGLVLAGRSPQSPMAAALQACLAATPFEARLEAAYQRLSILGEEAAEPSPRTARRVSLSWEGGRLRIDLENSMKLSARNVLPGTVVEVIEGAVTSHVRIDIGGGLVTASITNDAVKELGLKPGVKAYAVVKASDVMIGVDD